MPVGNAGSGTGKLAFTVEPLEHAPDVAPGTECRAPGPAWHEAEAAVHDAVARMYGARPVSYEHAVEDTAALWAAHALAKPFHPGEPAVTATFKVSKTSGYMIVTDGGAVRMYCIEVATFGNNVQLAPKLAASADGG